MAERQPEPFHPGRVPRCQHNEVMAWGLAQCSLPEDHDPWFAHAFVPSETRPRTGMYVIDED